MKTQTALSNDQRKITAKFYEADNEANLRAGWQFSREGDKFPAHERAHLAKTATDAQIAEHVEFEYGTSEGLEVSR